MSSSSFFESNAPKSPPSDLAMSMSSSSFFESNAPKSPSSDLAMSPSRGPLCSPPSDFTESPISPIPVKPLF